MGESIGSYYGYKAEGIFETREQFERTPHLESENQDVGDFIYADANKDGVVDATDRVILGSYNPDFIWGHLFSDFSSRKIRPSAVYLPAKSQRERRPVNVIRFVTNRERSIEENSLHAEFSIF